MNIQERDALIERLARRIEAAGMVAPAIAFLEANKPFSFLGSQALLFLQPLLSPFLPGTEGYVAFLEDRENVERLIRRLEGRGR